MSSSDYREPTNEELWVQPPPVAAPPPAPQGLAPLQHSPVPAPVHYAPSPVLAQRPDRTPFVLAIVSCALGIPLTAIASSQAGIAGLIVAWIGIVLVNMTYAWSRRRTH